MVGPWTGRLSAATTRRRSAWCAAIAVALTGSSCALASAQEARAGSQRSEVRGQQTRPLHERVDELVEAAAIGPLAPPCSDADFVRRVYLDLAGVIPTADGARTFLADSSPDKRERLIDELLASPAFLRHMTITLDVMLMERKTDKTVKQPQWEEFLYKSLADDKPLDQLFRELIAADGAEEALRPAGRFVLDRDAEPNLVTRDIGRLVFGMDLQCCQCHDHPLIDDYYQNDYYGLFAFVHRTSLFTDPKSKLVQLTEKADGEASFKSVFTGASSDKAQPRLPKGAVLFVEPTFATGDEYVVKPDKTVRGVPKFSRRAALAEMLRGSREFHRNLANRLWAVMFGRGLVHPVDFHFAGNPPANPELLSLLSDELQADGFKLRPMLRELALTRVYQRTCEAPRPEMVNFADVAARLERLTRDKEAQLASLQPLKDSLAKAKADAKSARDENAKIAAELPRLETAVTDARMALDKARSDQKVAEEAVSKARQQAQAVAEAAAKATEAVAILSDDKVLSEAAAKFAARAGELTAAAEAAAKTMAERASRHDAAAQHLASAETALAQASAARPTPERLKALEGVELTAGHTLADTNYRVAAINAQIATAKAISDYATLKNTDPVKAEAAWAALVERWTIANQIGALRPLSPEQLAASAMQASGILGTQISAAEAKLDKSPPDALKNASDADQPRVRSQLSQTELLGQLRGTFNEFVKHYGGLPGQDFQATVNQALFFGNGTTIDGWLKPAGENLVARLGKLEDTAVLADELYLSVLSRTAGESEKKNVAAYLKDRGNDKLVAIGEMIWALLSSSEFRFNH